MNTQYFKNKIVKIKEVQQLQEQTLPLFNDRYMRGLYNGIEVALAILEDREPKYKTKMATLIDKIFKIRKVKNK